MHPSIREVCDRVRRQTDELEELARGLDPAVFQRRPAEGRWSVAEHVAHLCNILPPYLQAMEKAVERARDRGWHHDGGPFRGTWAGRKFMELLEPPPKRRVRTLRAMEPPPAEEIDRERILSTFRRHQEDLVSILQAGDGLDLGRARLTSPFVPWLPLVRFAVIQSGGHMAAHTDRHLWLVREALDQMGVEHQGRASGQDDNQGKPGSRRGGRPR